MILDTKTPWIQVELSFDKEEENPYSIALPDDYRPAEKPYKAVSIVRDPEGEYKHGDVVVLPTHIIREIELSTNKFHLVERNHIMAVVRAE
jgi:co-chaperonin GroES (HSP10)|tara:strand:- start:27 stop:299 length:273 start_codon:yes stop_codon:yes gene_type:complete